jgi:Fe-S cluster assembly protein SufD
MGYGNYIDPFVGLRPPQDDSTVIPTTPVIPSEAKESYSVGAGEKLELTFVVLPGESRDINVTIDLVGEGAEVHLKGLYLCGGDERVNFRILMHHRVPGCVSRQLFNGIAGGSSRVTFDGRIIVAPDAQQTEAYQENHNILLSEGAHVETTPQLEIYADDVKCSHGATIGRLDEEALFYMRTRGVPEQEARVLQMLSFLAPVTPEADRKRVEKAVRHLSI